MARCGSSPLLDNLIYSITACILIYMLRLAPLFPIYMYTFLRNHSSHCCFIQIRNVFSKGLMKSEVKIQQICRLRQPTLPGCILIRSAAACRGSRCNAFMLNHLKYWLKFELFFYRVAQIYSERFKV